MTLASGLVCKVRGQMGSRVARAADVAWDLQQCKRFSLQPRKQLGIKYQICLFLKVLWPLHLRMRPILSGHLFPRLQSVITQLSQSCPSGIPSSSPIPYTPLPLALP